MPITNKITNSIGISIRMVKFRGRTHLALYIHTNQSDNITYVYTSKRGKFIFIDHIFFTEFLPEKIQASPVPFKG